MTEIFTREALDGIMADEGLTPEQRAARVLELHDRALDDGYIAKAAAKQAQETALEAAKAEWEKGQTAPDPKESDEYKALRGQFDAYRAMQAARTSADYAGVKPKFFETVYGMVDRAEGARGVAEQLADIRRDFQEYFAAPADAGGEPGGGMPPAVVLPSGGATGPGSRMTLSEAMRRANAGEYIDVSRCAPSPIPRFQFPIPTQTND